MTTEFQEQIKSLPKDQKQDLLKLVTLLSKATPDQLVKIEKALTEIEQEQKNEEDPEDSDQTLAEKTREV